MSYTPGFVETGSFKVSENPSSGTGSYGETAEKRNKIFLKSDENLTHQRDGNQKNSH
jgi:hypothetical protein